MPILNYTTSIEATKTIGEITQCLVKHGASKIVTDYAYGLPVSVTFCLPINGTLAAFVLPANYSGVLKAMQKDPKVPRNKCTDEQAIRVGWRIVKTWVDAQMAIVEANVAEIGEVFLPYLVTKSGNTLYKDVSSGDLKLLN